MAQSTTTKCGKKGRKFGRNADRSPSMKSYRNQNRMAVNKAKKISRHMKAVHAAAMKVLKVPHGAARAARRVGIVGGAS